MKLFNKIHYTELTDEDRYAAAQLGISAHITKNKEFLMGAPGVNLWSGSAIRYKDNVFAISARQIQRFSYAGYAIGSGNFRTNDSKELSYVMTAPRSENHFGQALIFSYDNHVSNDSENYIRYNSTLNGSQMGDYYGYAMLVSDLNRDGHDDLIITAPQHEVNGVPDVGAIYVYIYKEADAKNQFAFAHEVIEAPFSTKARFGTTITSLGDINSDGYNDIAVGAPFFNDTGAVVIYHGSAKGLEREPCQILQLPPHLQQKNDLFGHGLSKGVDIDGNGVPDFAIAAPNSESVYIYRAYPIVELNIKFNASAISVSPDEEDLTYTVCFGLKNGTEAVLKLNLIADELLKRVQFENAQNFFDLEVRATPKENCTTFKVALEPKPKQMFKAINTTLSIGLKYDGLEHLSGDFCLNCVTLRQNSKTTFTNIVIYNPGCGNETLCKVDLGLEMRVPPNLVIGVEKTLKIVFDIINHDRKYSKAYDTKLNITNSLNLPLAVGNTNCTQSIDSTVICDIRDKPYYFEEKAYLELTYDVEHITDDVELEIYGIITSLGNDSNLNDNAKSAKVQFKREGLLEIIGKPVEELLSFNAEKKNISIGLIYTLQNHGPSVMKNFRITLDMPVGYINENQQSVFYVNFANIFIKSQQSAENFNLIQFDDSYIQALSDQKNFSTIWLNLEELGITENRTKLQACGFLNTTLCIQTTQNLKILKPKADLILQLSIILEANVLRELLNVNENIFGYFVNATASFQNSQHSNYTFNTTTTPIAIEYYFTPNKPFWIYILGIIGGFLLVCFLAYTLYKFGFFKRATKEEMLLKINEKEAKETALAEEETLKTPESDL